MSLTSSSDLNPAGQRRAELARNLAEVSGRIAEACAAVGRDAAEVTLIAVTKTWPATDVMLLHSLGVSDFGENRDAEAAPKAAACTEPDITWHFVGQLQTNKARSVARYAHVVHSVDRPHLVRALGAAARAAGREVTCLVQVSLNGDPARGGVPPDGVPDIAEAVAAEPGLVIGGVMAMAPLDVPPAEAFAPLPDCSAAVRSVRAEATIVSAGMSADLEPAIAAGATHVRIGTALLGARRPPVM
jgi:pyridoxal phosphate enzyme (YggS family)